MLRLSIALILLAGPASAFGQDVFAPGASGLRIGQRVTVLIDGTCVSTPCPTRLVTGKVTELSAQSLVVDDGREQRELAATTIAFVERPRDRIWNGALIGFAVGFSIGFVGVLADSCDRGEWCPFGGPSFASAVGLLTGGIGAGVGAVTDAVIPNRRVIFARNAPSAQSASSGAAPVTFSVRF
jgi:hypothetical protein